jgi:hypothetical protein
MVVSTAIRTPMNGREWFFYGYNLMVEYFITNRVQIMVETQVLGEEHEQVLNRIRGMPHVDV